MNIRRLKIYAFTLSVAIVEMFFSFPDARLAGIYYLLLPLHSSSRSIFITLCSDSENAPSSFKESIVFAVKKRKIKKETSKTNNTCLHYNARTRMKKKK